MSVEKRIRDRIVVLSTLANDKVFFVRAVEGTQMPYIAVSKISAPRSFTHEGSDGMVVSRFQVSIYDKEYFDAKTEAEKIYGLQDFSDDVIAHVQLANENDFYENDMKTHHIALDFMVRYYE